MNLQNIALRNYNDTCQLIANKYLLPAPENSEELIQAVEIGQNMYGNEFIQDIQQLDIKANTIAEQEIIYKNRLDTSNVEQLKQEVAVLTAKLSLENELSMREYILDKIAYVQKLIIEKTAIKKDSDSPIHINNQKLLLGLTAIALMLIGSKIFNK